MWRWTMRIFVGLCSRSSSLLHSPAPRSNGLRRPGAGGLRLPDDSSTSEGTGCISGARAPARLPSFSRTGPGRLEPRTGALSSLMSARFTRCARTTGLAWVTAIPAHHPGQHAASRVSCTHSSHRSGIGGPVVLVAASIGGFDVRVFASDTRPCGRSRARGCLPRRPTHMKMPWLARVRSAAIVSRDVPTAWRVVRPSSRIVAAISAAVRARDEFPCSRKPGGRRRNHSHSGQRVGSQELPPEAHHSCPRHHRWPRSRGELATVATRSSLAFRPRMSDRREQSGHVVAVDQPEVVVDAIRTVVETARGHDVPLCPTPAANMRRAPCCYSQAMAGRAIPPRIPFIQ